MWVDRERALFGSWYEFFPRSRRRDTRPPAVGHVRARSIAAASDRRDGLRRRLPAADSSDRDDLSQRPEQHADAGPGDPGVPWAIGSSDGGHDAIHPDLGTIDDFDALRRRGQRNGLEVAIDLALQCSPDHPWVTEHPEWFTTRPDGTIAYAENPPKKYQDIYPLNFDNDYEGLYAEIARVVRLWMGHGIRIFRVDNPHTKPVASGSSCSPTSARPTPMSCSSPRPSPGRPMMQALAEVGFHQSYTYFTWRNTKAELESYLIGTVARDL